MLSWLKLRRYSWRERWLLMEAAAWLTLFAAAIHVVSFKRLTAWLGLVQVPVEAEFDTLERPDALPIGWAVRTVAARTLWTSTCLVQALAGTQMLYRRKISATLTLGVAMASPDKSERIEAHAWLKQGSVFFNG